MLKAFTVTMLVSASIVLHVASITADQDLRSLFHQNKVNQNCICLPKNAVHNSVPQILDSERHGLERLVVFVYFNEHTRKVKVYIPNSKMQELFPDMPLGYKNDVLVDMSEFRRNMHKYTENKIKLNPVNYIDPVIADNDSIYNANTIEEIELIYPSQDEHHVTINNINTVAEPDSLTEEQMFPSLTVSELPAVENLEVISNIRPEIIFKPNINMPEPHIDVMVKPKELIDDSMFQSWINIEQDNFPSNIQQYEWDINSMPNDDSHYNYFNDIIVNSDYISNHDKYPENPAFDQWIMREVMRFKHLHLPHDQNIDFNTVKSIIKNTLLQNRITIIGGILMDSEGNMYNITDLEMKPVILDIPVNYYRLLRESAANLRFAGNPHHLQILLISLGSQPKVLLSIPLGKIDLVDEKHLRHQSFDVVSPPVLSPQIIKKVIISQPSPISRQRSQMLTDPASESLESGENDYQDEWSNNYYQNKDNSIEHTKYVMDKLFSVSSESKERSGFPVADVQVPIHAHSPNWTDLELPGIKIIGGSAATGSGTPINNRGRSGIMP